MMYKKQNRPKCGCGNSQDPNGFCDGSHLNNQNKALVYRGFFLAHGINASNLSPELIKILTESFYPFKFIKHILILI